MSPATELPGYNYEEETFLTKTVQTGKQVPTGERKRTEGSSHPLMKQSSIRSGYKGPLSTEQSKLGGQPVQEEGPKRETQPSREQASGSRRGEAEAEREDPAKKKDYVVKTVGKKKEEAEEEENSELPPFKRAPSHLTDLSSRVLSFRNRVKYMKELLACIDTPVEDGLLVDPNEEEGDGDGEGSDSI